MRKEKGFTLMEMLVVIVIIGIILIIVFPNVSVFKNRSNQKKYETHMDVVVDPAVDLYVDQYKGELANEDTTCFNINYQTLISDGLIKEAEVICNGNIILRKVNTGMEPEYYLTCVDNNQKSLTTSAKVPSGCRGFNGKFNMQYEIYVDNQKKTSYDGSYYVKDAYVYFNSVSPYQASIARYEYTTKLDGTWKTIPTGSNLGSIEDLKNYTGIIYVRAIDSDGNESSSEEIPVKMDNTGPEFKTSITGDYLSKKLTITNATDKQIGSLSENPYSFDGGSTWVKGTSQEYVENKTVKVCVKDQLENISCNDVSITGIDRVTPTIAAKASKQYITQGQSNDISNYYNVTYSPLGGTTVCKLEDTVITNINQLEFGLNTLTCTATGVNTLTATTSVILSHSYTATGSCSSGTLVNNNACSFTSNASVCGTTCHGGYDNTNCSNCHTGSPNACKGGDVIDYNNCVLGNYAQSASCGPCQNRYSYVTAGGTSGYCPSGYERVPGTSSTASNNCRKLEGCYYQWCNHVDHGCAQYGTKHDDCATTENTCQYGCDSVWNACQSTTNNSCTRTSYLSYSCSKTGVNGNTKQTINPVVGDKVCNDSSCTTIPICGF